MSRSAVSRCPISYLLPCLLVLLLMLNSCGQADTGNVQTISSTPSGQDLQNAASGQQAVSGPPAYNFNKTATTTGLIVQLSGFMCSTNPGHRPDNLVLASNQLTYDAGQAQIIRNYLQLLEEHTMALGAPDVWTPPAPPKILRWLPGSTFCGGDYAITNTTNANIQIQSAGFKLTMPPEVNTNHYHHVSFCVDYGGCGQSGGSGCGYGVSLTLDNGNSGTLFDSPIEGDSSIGCSTPTPLMIAPQQIQHVNVTISDAHTRDRIYTGIPTLTVTTTSGQHVIPLPKLMTSLYLTHTDQFPCYQLEDDTFVPATGNAARSNGCPSKKNS